MAEKDEKKDKKEKEDAAPAADAAPPAKAGKSKLLLIVGGVVALVLLIGVPVAIFALKGSKSEGDTGELGSDAALKKDDASHLEGSQGEESDAVEEGTEAMGSIFPMETFVVNMQGGRFLRCQIQLEFVERDIPVKFYSKLVPIRDGVISILSKRNADDVLSEKGRTSLKKDLKDYVNESLRKEDVKNVFFTQFVVQ